MQPGKLSSSTVRTRCRNGPSGIDTVWPKPQQGERIANKAMMTPLARGLSILSAFDGRTPSLSNLDIAHATGLPAPTVLRLSRSLVTLGYLNHDEATRRYSLAPGSLALGYAAISDADIQRVASAEMRKFAEETHTLVLLGARDRLEVIVLDAQRSSEAIFDLQLTAGMRVQIAYSLMGWTLMAVLPEAERAYLHRKVERRAGQLWAPIRQRMLEKIDQVRDLGFATLHGHWEPEIAGVAAPILLPGRPPVVLACVSRAGAQSKVQVERELGQRLAALARTLEAACRTATNSNRGEMPPEHPSLHLEAATRRPAQITMTLDRGLQLLRAFHAERAPRTIRELECETGMSRSAAARLTSTLVHLGFLRRIAGSPHLELASGVFTIGHAFVETNAVTRLAGPVLQRLADRLGVCVALAVPDRLDMLYVAHRTSSRISTLRLGVGSLVPMSTTAIGRAWLWALPDHERARYMMPLLEKAGAQAVEIRNRIERAFDELRSTGVCTSVGEYQRHSYGIALPIRVGRSATPMSLACSAVDVDPDIEAIRRRIAPELRRAALELTAVLNHAHSAP
ncbi:MAG: HTH-type transcriptional regulator TsaQ1/TsaQ2 [Burkholderia lata]|uniref:HTH-type transcriptional regulator TsaQ1/TsaQ2 n=2 Tax=Burkholderia lata (strain ATCC 17760 / DSM 23089 / LMG 22485 / NCIMB 9086 / R18194 / 383) TaxID=482957 RepID=A0A833V3G1_BURL3|nr:MAG: HTH-type transcriptional regulator TsaQ1/TsaQ2 [Burkholderia lata]